MGVSISRAGTQADSKVEGNPWNKRAKRLDEMQSAYKAAVEAWIVAIREEEALASVNHSVAEIDRWEHAHFHEEELRNKAKAAKKEYEGALRFKFFAIPE